MTTMPKGAARRVRLVLLDADGVLTDGGIYVADDSSGSRFELRRFHVLDGIAVYMLRRAHLRVALVSGKNSAAVRQRAADLGIEEVHQVDPYRKLQVVEDVLERLGVSWEETAFLGDDLADLPVLLKVGLPAAVANAVPEVREVARWHGAVSGGSGAVREFVESLLRARGEWSGLVDAYVRQCLAASEEIPGE